MINLEFIIGPVTVSIISTLLALVISLIDKIVNNYGSVTLSINNEQKKLDVKGGMSLLSTLADNRIFLPSACGGKGSCGVCKAVVKEGGG